MINEYFLKPENLLLMYLAGIILLSLLISLIDLIISSLIIYIRVDPINRKYYKIFSLSYNEINDPSIKKRNRVSLILLAILVIGYLLTIIAFGYFLEFTIDDLMPLLIFSAIVYSPFYRILLLIESIYTEFTLTSIFNKINNKFIH